MNQLHQWGRRAFAVLALFSLAACGGGDDGEASVLNMGATDAAFSKTMLITVTGRALEDPDLTLVVDGPCDNVVRVAGGSELSQQFSCKVSGLGTLVARVRVGGGPELASLRVNIPAPQVSMTVTQGTRSGTFVVELDPVAAPITVNNFLTFVNGGFYRSVIFHRVIADFVAQAGGFTAGPTARNPTLPPIALEAGNGLLNLRGTIAMARTAEPNSATSQFYLNLVDNPSLDVGGSASPDGYAVFGKVIRGMEVVDEIGLVPTFDDSANSGLPNLPVTNVVITAASQTK